MSMIANIELILNVRIVTFFYFNEKKNLQL